MPSNNPKSNFLWGGVWLLSVFISVLWLWPSLKFESSILKLLPKYQDPHVDSAVKVATERLGQQMILLVEGTDSDVLLPQFESHMQAWQENALFDQVNYKIDSDWMNELYQLLHAHRHALWPINEIDRSPEFFVAEALMQLHGGGMLSEQQLRTDPLFMLQRLLGSLSQLSVFQLEGTQEYYGNRNHA